MDLFKSIGNFFRGAFGGESEEEKKRRRRREAQAAQKKQAPRSQSFNEQGQKVKNVQQLFGQKKTDPFTLKPQPLQQNQPPAKPAPVAPKVAVPKVNPNQYNEIKQKALGYQKPKVQDVNNYYGNDVKVLQDELAKGDKADIMRVQGLMRSLDNRTKELKEFHKQRGESQSFKSARELEQNVKSTRGNWEEENKKLKNFWDETSKNEKDDFIKFLNERGVTKPEEQREAALKLVRGGEDWRSPGGRAVDFTPETEKIKTVKSRQQIADEALKFKDTPLDQLNNVSIQGYLDQFKKQSPEEQRKTLKSLEKNMAEIGENPSNNKDQKRKLEQSYILYNVLEDSGLKRTNLQTNVQDFGEGAASFAGSLVESPGRVIQSAGALAGADPGGDLVKAHQKGELTDEEFNRKMAEYQRSMEWVGDGKGGRGQDALKALGIATDTVATFLPASSLLKGAKLAKGADLARRGGQEVLEQSVKNSLKKTMAREAAINAGFSGVGALRSGEVDAEKIAGEALLGAGLGAAAPVVGNRLANFAGGKTVGLWKRLRGMDDMADDQLENFGKFASRPSQKVDDVVLPNVRKNVRQELEGIIGDPELPAFQRKQAQELLDAQPDAPVAAAGEGLERPSFMVKQDIQNVLDREMANLNRYVNENPDLTPQQIEAAQLAAKVRIVDLTDKIKASRAANNEAIEGQATAVDEAAKGQVAAIDEVRANQEAAVTPAAGDRLQTPEEATPEVAANDAYGTQYKDTFDMTDDVLRRADIDTTTRDRNAKNVGAKRLFHKLTGGFISDPYKAMVDKIRDAVGDKAYQATSSENVFNTIPGRVGALFGNNSQLKDSVRQIARIRNDAQSAAGDAVKRLHDNISDKVANLPDNARFNQKIDQFFESPEFLARRYGEGTPKITLDDMAPPEREIAETLIEMNKMRNLALFRQGKIDMGEYKLFADGMHSPRLYDFEKLGKGGFKGNKLIDTTSTMKRSKLEDISDETFAQMIESPAQRMLIRLEMALRSNASHDALKALDEAGMILDRPPNNQFSKLEGARWGNYQGKYVYNPIKGQLSDTIVMNTETGQHFGDLVDKYRESPFGATDRFFKKTKTVYSPGTFVGNVMSNPLYFNRGAGVNPIGQAKRMAKAGVDLVQHRTGRKFDPDIYEAQRHGVFSSDTGKQITGENNPELSVANKSRTNPFESTYGGADDAAKLAVWRGLRARGVEPELAARRVAQFTQDYNNAGRLVRTLADMPVIGRPFARFAPELVRLTKNNLLYNPVGMVAGAAGIALLQQELANKSGETPEEREARETAMGQTLIPFTAWLNNMLTGVNRDISLNFPVGDSAVNIARAVGMNFPQDASGDPNMALIKSIAPWAIPTRENAQGEMVFAPEELFTSMGLSPIAQQVANRDFIGREITDPQNKTYFENGDSSVRKFAGEPSQGDQIWSRFSHLFQNYMPLGSEINALGSAVQGKGDYYDKERTVPEAIARIFGAKAESNTEERQEQRVETKKYFEEDLPAVQKFVNDNPDLADIYFKLKNPTRNRETDAKVSDLITPEKWDLINSDTSGRLFNFLKEQGIKAHEKSIAEAKLDPKKKVRPLDPIYQLPEDQAKYVAELRSRPSGDDIEASEILRATSTWYADYEDRYHDYLNKNSEYFDNQPAFEGAAKENPRVEEYGKASPPVEQPPIIKEYFQLKQADPEQAKEVYKANKEELSAAFDDYAVKRLDRINSLRKIEGYEPISLEVFKNKTFGFDMDDGSGGFSKSGGGGGGRKAAEPYGNLLGELSDFSGSVDRLKPIEAAAMPQLAQMFAQLQAGRGGGKTKPKLGASSSGR